MVVAVYRAAQDLLGGLHDHAGDLLAHLSHRRLLLALYLLASPLDYAVGFLAGLLLGPLALGLADLAGLLAGFVDLLPVLLEKLTGLSPGLLRLVYSLLDGLLATLYLIPYRWVDEPVEQGEQDRKGHDLP